MLVEVCPKEKITPHGGRPASAGVGRCDRRKRWPAATQRRAQTEGARMMKRRMAQVVAVGALLVTATAGAGVAAETPGADSSRDAKSTVPTSGNDQIRGTMKADVIAALAGNDVVQALAGDDTVRGDDGNDVLIGAGGNDTLSGGRGYDKLVGGPGNDTMTGDTSMDFFFGADGSDSIKAKDGQKDFVSCGAGKDAVEADKIDIVAPDCEGARSLLPSPIIKPFAS